MTGLQTVSKPVESIEKYSTEKSTEKSIEKFVECDWPADCVQANTDSIFIDHHSLWAGGGL